jgi:thioredoxin-related protein
LPELQEVADDLAARGVVLITVATSGSHQRIGGVASRVGLRAPIVIADPELLGIYHVDHVPATFLIDKHGKAVESVRGAQDGAFFRKLASRHL